MLFTHSSSQHKRNNKSIFEYYLTHGALGGYVNILTMTNEESKINTQVTNQQEWDIIEKYSVGGFNITDAAHLTNIEYETARKTIDTYKKEQRSEKKKTGKAVDTTKRQKLGILLD